LKYREEGRDPDEHPEEFKELVKKQRKIGEQEREQILELGGLYIVGTERHEARRIDNQLRGRSGRQGDPGRSRFYLSLEDDLMRIFAGDRVKNLMERMGMPDGEPIEHPWVTKSVENAQKKVEERNFDIRKNVLEYDDVMSSQRATVYTLRQQLLLGEYKPEILNDEGKATGEFREISTEEWIADEVRPQVAALIGMFCEDPILPRDEEGEFREIERAEFDKAGKLVEPKALQQEVYGYPYQQSGLGGWGVKGDFEDQTPLEAYDECVVSVPQALTEQRERCLDMLDRIIGAMIEDLCPANKTPDDWDWTGLFEGFTQHFGVELDDDIADNSDREALAVELYDLAEQAYKNREEEVGLELILRVFRHIYLEELDRAWVDHLTDMDHLRDGIGLRGYGQKDPKQEYKKEGYNMFLTMMARVSSNVVTKVMSVQVRRGEEEQELEAAASARHLDVLSQAVASHGEQVSPASQQRGEPETPPVLSEEKCPCGSGKKFSECHGAN